LELIDERFPLIPYFSDICQVGDKLTRVKQWTGVEYKDMAKVWCPALAPLSKRHPAHFQFIKSVTEFLLIASCHFNTKTTLKYLQDALGGISSNIHLFLPYCKSHSMSKIPKSIPFCTISNVLGKWTRPITVTLKYKKPIIKTSSGMATVLPTR